MSNMDPNVTFRQFGGGRAMVMIGGQALAAPDRLTIKFKAPAINKANTLVITLDADDTYTMTFWKIRGAKMTQLEAVEGVYCDQLRPIFEKRTGLYLSL